MNKLQVIKKDLEQVKKRFTDLVGEDLWAKESSFAIQIFRKNPRLMDCVPESILEAVLNVAQIGLTLNPASKMAYLVPRYNAGASHCVLEPSYQGLVKLVTDTGSVVSVSSHVVYSDDEFGVTLGTSPEVIHKPSFSGDKKVTHVYAVADLGNSKQIEVMTMLEIQEIMAKSESYKAFKAGKVRVVYG